MLFVLGPHDPVLDELKLLRRDLGSLRKLARRSVLSPVVGPMALSPAHRRHRESVVGWMDPTVERLFPSIGEVNSPQRTNLAG